MDDTVGGVGSLEVVPSIRESPITSRSHTGYYAFRVHRATIPLPLSIWRTIRRDTVCRFEAGAYSIRIPQRKPAEMLEEIARIKPKSLRTSCRRGLIQTLLLPINQRNIARVVPCHHARDFDNNARRPIILDIGDDNRPDLPHPGMVGVFDPHEPNVV